MNTSNNSTAIGQKPPFSGQSIGDFFRSFRRSEQTKTPPQSNGSYRAQDHVAYSPDGAYSHGKPLGGETQFGIEGKVPAPAFGMKDAAIAAFMVHARAAAFVGETLDTVRAQGARLFDARYAELKAQFEGRMVAARRLIEPLESRAAVIRHEAESLPLVIKSEKDKFCLPQDWRLLAIVVLLGLWGFVTYSEWINAAARQLYLVQDWDVAKKATVPWLAVGVVIEWIIISSVGAAGVFWRKVWRVASLASIFLYAGLYAVRHGTSAEGGVASAIASAMAGTDAVASGAGGTGIDQALYFGQLFFGLVCGATLLEAVLHLMVGRDVTVSNPDRQQLESNLSALIERINQHSAPLWKAQGHLAEYQASREAFIDFGVRAYHAVEGERQIFDHERQLLERERDLLERKRCALLN